MIFLQNDVLFLFWNHLLGGQWIMAGWSHSISRRRNCTSNTFWSLALTFSNHMQSCKVQSEVWSNLLMLFHPMVGTWLMHSGHLPTNLLLPTHRISGVDVPLKWFHFSQPDRWRWLLKYGPKWDSTHCSCILSTVRLIYWISIHWSSLILPLSCGWRHQNQFQI